MKYYAIGAFAKLIGVTQQTLRNWDKVGKLKPSHTGKSGYRYYSQQQLQCYLGFKGETVVKRKVIGYCRVSSNNQKDELERQVENVKTYMIAIGYSFEVVTDIGSGINYNKKGLNELIDKVIASEVEKIVVLYKDRLLRFGYELIENLCHKYGTTIDIIDNTEKTEEQELAHDLIQIITVYGYKLQGKRANKANKMIKELLEDDNSSEG
ncbi:IS607 family transposase [Cellulosilyticum sp. I15G10I2]|uniref:IS607 family transposase n=1 Tax=Cellulosilyticum sp. I15G10I2 TaxID=1892843 RepID=UPI00085BECD1|nr:IS607 family transposase [Cellulosilyticum sp. I15G10I2]